MTGFGSLGNRQGTKAGPEKGHVIKLREGHKATVIRTEQEDPVVHSRYV